MPRFGNDPEASYTALIGDLVESRNAPARGDLQRRLLGELERLNLDVKGSLTRPLSLTAGDEVQGLFSHPEGVVPVVVALSDVVAPERWSFGVGHGDLTTDLHEDVARIDGPCFHRAREALERAGADRWLAALGFGATEDAVLTALFTLMNAVRGRWTDKQLDYIRAARRKPQKEVARDFGVSPSTVSESLKSASFTAVLDAERAVMQLLEHFGLRGECTANSGGEPK